MSVGPSVTASTSLGKSYRDLECWVKDQSLNMGKCNKGGIVSDKGLDKIVD